MVKTLEAYKRNKPEKWKNIGQNTKILVALYFHSSRRHPLNKKSLKDVLIKEMDKKELEERLIGLEKTEAIYIRKSNPEEKVYITKNARRAVKKKLYLKS